MSEPDDDTEKPFDATPQKLLEARKKGEVAKSADLMTAAAYAGFLCALGVFGQSTITDMGTTFMVIIERTADQTGKFQAGSGAAWHSSLIRGTLWPLLPMFLFPAIAVMLTVAVQRALVFAPNKLSPKLSRISPLANAKNKFGRSGLFEFFKSTVKLCLYSVCLAAFINSRMDDMLSVLRGSPQQVLSLLAELCLTFLMVVVLISGAIGILDAFWQHWEHLRKNRMSRKEIMDETKNAEGDPHLKQERRQRAMSIAQNQMMADVPTADVIIVNPTHYAVALKWSRKPGEAPACVAKGVDEIAKAIREVAQSAGIPIHSDPPTARALHATVEIGAQIDVEHYSAVAAAIRFAEAMRQRAKDRG